ncbi:MAG: hypothetical protein V1718_03990 [archaeon]
MDSHIIYNNTYIFVSMLPIPEKAELESMKDRLRNIHDIILSSHTIEHLKDQPIKEEEIKQAIWNPEELIFIEQQDAEIGEKYKLVFHQSGKYDFVLVVLFTGNQIKVITVRKQNKKRLRIMDQWNKRVVHR